jgi:hypothetical protein
MRSLPFPPRCGTQALRSSPHHALWRAISTLFLGNPDKGLVAALGEKLRRRLAGKCRGRHWGLYSNRYSCNVLSIFPEVTPTNSEEKPEGSAPLTFLNTQGNADMGATPGA